MKKSVLDRMLAMQQIHPVLMDIGAAGQPPRVWRPIARHAIYVGFDPDRCQSMAVPEGTFFKTIILNQAVVSTTDNDAVFYLTRSPLCSSTLVPATDALSDYLFADLFAVEKQVQVPAVSLRSVLDQLGLSRVDWLKIDTQGTDLRIFNSLPDETRSRVFALDIEPGLIHAYEGEDLFVDAHKELTQNGFWLSNLNVRGAVRLRPDTVRETQLATFGLQAAAKKSPAWCEARYLRTLEWLAAHEFAKHDYVVLWVFAVLDGQAGFALDIAMQYKRQFGQDDTWRALTAEAERLLRRRWRHALWHYVQSGWRRIANAF